MCELQGVHFLEVAQNLLKLTSVEGLSPLVFQATLNPLCCVGQGRLVTSLGVAEVTLLLIPALPFFFIFLLF